MPEDDKEKHRIRDEVERQLHDPPSSFAKWIEDEVERQVKKREIFYRWIGAIAFGALITVLGFWFHATINDVGEKVNQALSEKKVIEVRDRILKIGDMVEEQARSVSNRAE